MDMYYPSSQNTFTDYYQILGVPFDASQEDIKKAHRRLVKKMHPDTLTDEYYGDYDDFVMVDEAYKTLNHPFSKEHYDFLYRKYVLEEPYLKSSDDGSCSTSGSCKSCGPDPENATSGSRFLTYILLIALVFAFVLRGLI